MSVYVIVALFCVAGALIAIASLGDLRPRRRRSTSDGYDGHDTDNGFSIGDSADYDYFD